MFIKQIEMHPFGMVLVELSNSRKSPSDQGYGFLLGPGAASEHLFRPKLLLYFYNLKTCKYLGLKVKTWRDWALTTISRRSLSMRIPVREDR